MSRSKDELIAEVQAWIAADPDEASRQELRELLAAEAFEELGARFSGLLAFGTAGLRGLLGAGPSRMNRALVIRASAGVCETLLARVEGAQARGICIGHDARRLSREFAQDAIQVALAKGFRVYAFEGPNPTPLVGFHVLARGAAAGIVVTASHNPPDYNGYKVFWENGAQIIPPIDAEIAAAIAGNGPANEIPRSAQGALVQLGDAAKEEYLEGIASLVLHPELQTPIKVAYTALHGVGSALVRRAFAQGSFGELVEVAEQAEPDGRFPTVEFPNPEEEGAMDAVIALAQESGADVALANDPDADRLAIAVRHEGAFVKLSGNEIGCLLAHYLLSEGARDDKAMVLNTIVSSPMLLAIAKAHGAHAEQTLTGHKWIHNRAIALEREGLRFVFGYEEALGYAPSAKVRDKDGISTLVLACDLARWCKSRGKTLVDELAECARRYGMYLSEQVSLVLPGAEGAAEIRQAMEKIRQAPPSALGGFSLVAWEDLSRGIRYEGGQELRRDLPASDVILLELEGGHRAMLRPSGTEPKLKHYFDVRVELAEGESAEDARARGRVWIDSISADLLARTRP